MKLLQNHGLLVAIFLLNLLQIYFTELHPDEAYYWVFSQNLAWGYFDHPPMAALWIKIGYAILGNEMGVRLLFACAQVAALKVAYELTNQPKTNAPHIFYALALALPLVQTYGFIATPDMPFLLFGILFLAQYKRFLAQNNAKNALVLGFLMAAMAYSKYHSVVVVICVIAANPAILRQKYAYLAAATAAVLLVPHIYWQIVHQFPTLKYHLAQRQSGFNPSFVFGYVFNQLLVFNPMLVLFFTAYFFGNKTERTKSDTNDVFQKTLLYISVGFVAFFFINSFRGKIEPHWTFFANITAVMFVFIRYLPQILENVQWASYLKKTLYLSFILIFVIRLNLVFNIAHQPELARLFFTKTAYMNLKTLLKNEQIVFLDSYQNASKYSFYAQKPAYSLNTQLVRKNQFDLLNFENKLKNKPVYIVQQTKGWGLLFGKTTPDAQFKYFFLDSFTVFPKIGFKKISVGALKMPPFENKIRIEITNPYDFEVAFSPNFMPNISLWQQKNALRDVPIAVPIRSIAAHKSVQVWAKLRLFDEIKPEKYNFALGAKPHATIAVGNSETNTIEIIK